MLAGERTRGERARVDHDELARRGEDRVDRHQHEDGVDAVVADERRDRRGDGGEEHGRAEPTSGGRVNGAREVARAERARRRPRARRSGLSRRSRPGGLARPRRRSASPGPASAAPRLAHERRREVVSIRVVTRRRAREREARDRRAAAAAARTAPARPSSAKPSVRLSVKSRSTRRGAAEVVGGADDRAPARPPARASRRRGAPSRGTGTCPARPAPREATRERRRRGRASSTVTVDGRTTLYASCSRLGDAVAVRREHGRRGRRQA